MESLEKLGKRPNYSKIKNILKSIALALTLTLTPCSCNNSDNDSKEKIIVIEKWQTLSQIINDNIIKPNDKLSEDEKWEWKLRQDIINEIVKENKLYNPDKLSPNDTIKINMDNINKIIESHHTHTTWISYKWNKKEKEKIVENVPYTTIHSIEEFKNSKNYLIKKIYNDNNINWKFKKALEDWYNIKFLNPIETKDSPSLSLDEITKPNKIIDNELSWKEFTLDPGHGSLDTWAIGLAQYWDDKNKEKVAVYESALMMDLAYRVARELRAHWAKVNLTHYMNKRWIMDSKDLPPCSRIINNEWKELFQDIWDGTSKNSNWTLFNADWKYLTKRAQIANSHQTNLLISMHADMLRNGNKIDNQSKILSIKYDERQKNPKSKSIANKLIENGFWYYYNWELAKDVKRNATSQKLWALKPCKSPAILIEFGNISQESQAYILREYTKREELAKNLVSSLIKVYKNN